LDDKVVTSWNGLMLRALSEASQIFGRDEYRTAAVRNAEFLQAQMWLPTKRLLRTWRGGQSKGDAYLEDYGCLLNGLLSLYEATFDRSWFIWARELAVVMVEQFGDTDQGGFFDTSREHETLVLRPKEFFDNAMPSGNSAAAEAMLRLAAFTGDPDERGWGISVARLLLPVVVKYPTGFGHLLCAIDRAVGASKEIAIVGRFDEPDTRSLVTSVFAPYLPNKVVAGAEPGDRESERVVPLLEGRVQASERPLAYVCENFTCEMPVSDPESLARLLGVGA
jgi:uncharacterized protein YyaL (SSP411 family)